MGISAIKQDAPKVYPEWSEPYLLKAIYSNKVTPLENLRAHLYRDETGDLFLLFGNMEIYLKHGYTPGTIANSVCAVQYFNKKARSYVVQSGLFGNIFGDSVLGDAEIKIGDLKCVLPRFVRKKSLSKNSQKLKRMEEILGHRILPLSYDVFYRLIEVAKEPLKEQ